MRRVLFAGLWNGNSSYRHMQICFQMAPFIAMRVQETVLSALVKERKVQLQGVQEDSCWRSKTTGVRHRHGLKKIPVVPKNLFPSDSTKTATVTSCGWHHFI